MKKIIMLMMIIGLGLSSCKKEDIKPNVEEVVDCNCGTVIQIIDSGMTSGFPVWTVYKIKNNCNGMIDERTHYSNSSYPTPNVMDIICN